MSRFDRFGRGDGQNLPVTSNASMPVSRTEGAARLLDRAKMQKRSTTADQITSGVAARVAIALDATGSMAYLISAAKESIAEIIARTSQEAGRRVEMRIFVYRDYDVPRQLLEQSPLSHEPNQLVSWLRRIEALGGGGNSGEAVEAALQAIHDDGKFDVTLLTGDEPSNSRANLNAVGRRQALTARELAQAFGQSKKPIHTFVVDRDPQTIRDFAAIAAASGGKSGRLDGSREMIDLAVMAILSAIKGATAVRQYMEGRTLSANARDYGALLLGHNK